MSFPRLFLVLLPVALGLPLLTGGCGVPVIVAAASYGADGVSVVETGKTTTDHLTSMVSKKDCALWRVLRNRSICEEQDPSKPNPYKVNYDEPFRQQGEGSGIEYSPPAHAAQNAPTTSWEAATYKPAPPQSVTPTTAVAESAPVAAVEPPAPVPTPPKPRPKAKKIVKAAAPPKKLSPDLVASSR